MSREPSIHIVIPDTQVKPGVPTQHLDWIGRYIVESYAGRERVTIIHLGDHWDMPSLSYYDKGKKAMEGRRYTEDVDAGNAGMDLLNAPLYLHNKGRRKKWEPRRVILRGNHEERIQRACEADAQLDGALSFDDFNDVAWGWEPHDFLEPVEIDGVMYAHYFANPMTGRPYGGQSIDARLKTIGYSFTMGHQQGLHRGMRSLTNGHRVQGMIAGSCYLHDEDYLGPQGNNVWRGLVVCHQVERGEYDAMEVSLDYLCRRYEGVRLSEFVATTQLVACGG